MQPFVSYIFGRGQSFTLTSQSTYDWNDEDWTVPITLTYQQIVKLGTQPVQFQLGGTYYATAPNDGPTWGIRTSMIFLFPTKGH